MAQPALPIWLDEKQWDSEKLNPEILQNIHIEDILRPTAEEWKEYFVWLARVPKFTEQQISAIRDKKIWQRSIDARLCFFLHFYRLGIPLCQIREGKFGSASMWKKLNRKPWKGASYVYIPIYNGTVDWWCTNTTVASVAQLTMAKASHKLQSYLISLDEKEEKPKKIEKHKHQLKVLKDFGSQVDQFVEESKTFLERYAAPNYVKLIKPKQKQDFQVLLQELINIYAEYTFSYGANYDQTKVALDNAYRSSLQCFEQCHVAFAQEKYRLEQQRLAEEQERVRKEEERIRKEQEEKQRLEEEAKAREEQERIQKELAENPKEAEEQKGEDEENQMDDKELEQIELKCKQQLEREIQEMELLQKERGNPKAPIPNPNIVIGGGSPIVPPHTAPAAAQGVTDTKEIVGNLEKRAYIKEIIDNPPIKDEPIVCDIISSIEQFTFERIVTIARKLQLPEEELINLLVVNQYYADTNRRRVKRSQGTRTKVEASLKTSGLL